MCRRTTGSHLRYSLQAYRLQAVQLRDDCELCIFSFRFCLQAQDSKVQLLIVLMQMGSHSNMQLCLINAMKTALTILYIPVIFVLVKNCFVLEVLHVKRRVPIFEISFLKLGEKDPWDFFKLHRHQFHVIKNIFLNFLSGTLPDQKFGQKLQLSSSN